MSTHSNSHDNVEKIVLAPHLRAWFHPRRSWHKQKVRVHAEARWIADGAKASVRIYLADAGGNKLGSPLDTVNASISNGRLVGSDGANGVPHALDWTLPGNAAAAAGLVATVAVAEYGVQVDSTLLELDLLNYVISG